MKPLIATIALTLTLATAANAQSEKGEIGEGVDLLQQGTRLLLEGLMNELGPALKDLEDMVGDLSMYYPPEILPNGDIIIRRKTPVERALPDPDSGEIDL